jgi:4-amino-4-deoxy-L-arabinose transferase-like glycosyltransferase
MTPWSTLVKPSWRRDGLILLGLWLVAAIADQLWIFLDQAPPAWDQGDHLTRALNHWWVLQHPRWFAADWWRTLWQQAPTQRGPLVALLTVPFFALLGPSLDTGLLVNLVFSAVLLGSLYLMGRRLFSPTVGLWAAGLGLLSPLLATLRLEYLLDYGLTAVVAFTLMGLTYWWTARTQREMWIFTGLWGLGMAMTLLTRTSGLLFLIVALGWPLGLMLYQCRWAKLGQWAVGLGLGILLIWPWFSTSWLTIISTTFESNAHGAIYRQDPQANSLAGWLYYPQQLPGMVSPPIFFAALGAGLVALVMGLWPRFRWRSQPATAAPTPPLTAWLWLGGIVLGILVLGALGTNKQPRLLAPVLPMVFVALAQLLGWQRGQPWAAVRWLAALGAAVLVLWSVFPLPGAPLGPSAFFPQPTPWPNAAIVQAMAETEPHLASNLGMAVNTQQLNPAGMDFIGGSADFQVFARQLA